MVARQPVNALSALFCEVSSLAMFTFEWVEDQAGET